MVAFLRKSTIAYNYKTTTHQLQLLTTTTCFLEHYKYIINPLQKPALGFLKSYSSYSGHSASYFAKIQHFLNLQDNYLLSIAPDYYLRFLRHCQYIINQLLKPALGFLKRQNSYSSHYSGIFAKTPHLYLLLHHFPAKVQYPCKETLWKCRE